MVTGSDMTITLVTAGAAAIINLWLAVRTGTVRTKAKISIGDGGDETLIRRMRTHSNYIEYAPFILILIALLEFTSGSSWWLWTASVLFLFARIVHPLGMDGWRFGREAGTWITLLLLLTLGGYAIAVPLLPHAARTITVVSAVPAG